MLRVTVELVPFGVGTPKVIGQMIIGNDGTGTPTRGNYEYQIWTRAINGKNFFKPWRQGRIVNFPRKSKNVWYLIKRLLENAL